MADWDTTSSGTTGKRKAEEAEGSDKKRHELIQSGGIKHDDVPPVSYKLLLEETLPKLPTLPDAKATTQKAGELKLPHFVFQNVYADQIMRIIEALPDHQVQIASADSSGPTSITSTASGIAAMQNWIFNTCNAILSQWPNDEFIRRWQIRKNPDKDSDHPSGQPDSYLEMTFDKDGRPNPEPVRLIALVEEQWETFSAQQSPEVIETDKLDLWEAFSKKRLSEKGRRAFLQALNPLFNDEQLQCVFLYTPAALWVIESGDRPHKRLAIVSEPFPASSQNPTMKQAVFAIIFRELMSARTRMEGAENWLEPFVRKPPEELPWSDNDEAQGADGSASGFVTLAAVEGDTDGDQLLRELEDTDSPRCGNSVVRLGRLRGTKVAAKIVRGDAEDWIKEEIENEGRAFKALKTLQGSVIPEVIFFGKVNEGKDWLLVTKFVEGVMLDKVQISEEIAANARSASQAILDQGCIHGDVMPRNIFVTETGECVFIDLGRTKRVKDGSKMKDQSMRYLNVLLKRGSEAQDRKQILDF
ncbi:Protein kinase-like domain containing protein [Klebsormidium nitens]|uniref:Protein kinase-like domain containing protein n=1 Tax=Klebsormidium nitens TaxID=105231 RepID=A0A1Y1I319_KLENI|nr:Protein kinase-like domain containing protein [Klebsormidium nitens]|eukprot:GAQ83581.1 Protein kinase-like domain containing protein [Klebsormidium nitens]